MSMRLVLMALAASLVAAPALAEEVALCDLVRDPDVYDGRTVTVSGDYDASVGDNGALSDPACADVGVATNLTTQPDPSQVFADAVEAANGAPIRATAVGVFRNFPGDAPSLQLDVETIRAD